jgi:hypothetical protein
MNTPAPPSATVSTPFPVPPPVPESPCGTGGGLVAGGRYPRDRFACPRRISDGPGSR